MDKFQKFIQLIKVDVAQRLVYGLVTAEREDKDGEICEYASTKPEYKAVNDEMSKASGGENIMPLREMHQLNAVGCGKSIDFDDAKKEIRMAFKVVDDGTWNKVLEKVLIGFSQGGRYVKRWTEGAKKYYTAAPGEVSLVDNPCLQGAVIEYVKADGSVESFKVPDPPLARLTDADIDRLSKAVADSILGTHAKEIDAALAERMRQQSAATGENMKPDQIKKCAEALGISEAEFVKTYVEGDALEKGKKGLAALHSHLKKAIAVHGKLHEMHKAMADHHKDLHEHLQDCMKAHGACMEDGEAEKILKALIPPPIVADPDPALFVKKADVDAQIAKARTEAIEEFKKSLPAGDAADRAVIVLRNGTVVKANGDSSTVDPIMR